MPTSIYGGENALWGTEMNTQGVMGFVDRVWILLNRIFILIIIIMIILIVIALIAGSSVFKSSSSFKVSRK